MARLHNPHNGAPVNPGEQMVVDRLVAELPRDYVVVPSVEINDMEIDAIVIAPHAVILVEVKSFRPERRVIFDEHEHLVDSEVRKPPQRRLWKKSQLIKSRLERHEPNLSGVWVSGQVVVPQAPNFLEIASEIEHLVCVLDDAIERFTQPELIIREGFVADWVDEDAVLGALGYLKKRRRVERYGDYETQELVEQSLAGRTYVASRRGSDQSVLLHIHEIDSFQSPEERQRQRRHAQNSFQVLEQLVAGGIPAPEIAGPIATFETPEEHIAVVSPLVVHPTLVELVDEATIVDERVLLLVVRDVAKALRRAHELDISHRRLTPSLVHVLVRNLVDVSEVVAQVGGWDRASSSTSSMSTIHAGGLEEERQFFAPEVLNGQEVSQQAVDLYALGVLIRWLWEHLSSEPFPEEFAEVCSVLCAEDWEEREAASAHQIVELATFLRSELDREVERPDGPVTLSEIGIGSIIGDRYQVQETLGSGATSAVFAVHDPVSNQEFALKVFKQGIQPEAVRREFSVLYNLTHPAVVRVNHLTHGEVGICLVMERLHGVTLREKLDASGPLELEQCLPWFLDVLDALSVLHDSVNRVVHRDVKPENIMLTEDPQRLVLLDFGMASDEGDATAGGTTRYRPATLLDPSDPANDLFAFLLVVHEALTGEHPFVGDGPCVGEPDIRESLTSELQQFFATVLSPGYLSSLSDASQLRELLLQAAQVVDDQGADSPVLDEDTSESLRQIEVGSKVVIEIDPGHETRRIAETPAGRPDVEVRVIKATFRALPDIVIDVEMHTTLGDDSPADREQWVQAVNAYNSPPRFHRLTRGLRQTSRIAFDERQGQIPDDIARSMDLRQARVIDNPDWPRIRKVTLEELDRGLGGDTSGELLLSGALSVGTREEVWGDTSRRRGDICVTYPHDPETDLITPLIAYAICRVAPLVTDEWADTPPDDAIPSVAEALTPLASAAESVRPQEVISHQAERINRMVRLCADSEPLWSHEQRCYSETDLTVAPILAEELNTLRDELARDCLHQIVRVDDRASELRLAQSPGPRLNGERWRSSTWIDLLFAYERDGTEIDYDKMGRSPRGGHLFRVWITAGGFGIGIRPGLNREHQTRDRLVTALPDGFPNLEPKAQGPESAHPHFLVGVRGRSNQYFAKWSEAENFTDTDFFSTLEDTWLQLGPLLDEYRC